MKLPVITLALALLGFCGQVLAQNAPQPTPVVKPSTPAPPVPGGGAAAKGSGSSALAPVLKPSTPAPWPAAAATSGKVWGALVYATAGRPAPLPASVPLELANLSKRLASVTVLGAYNRFEILGDRSQSISRQYESWVVPSKDLFLKLESKGPGPNGGLRLDMQYWYMDKVMVKTDATLKPHSPLFIVGPKWREGRLVFVLMLTEGAMGK